MARRTAKKAVKPSKKFSSPLTRKKSPTLNWKTKPAPKPRKKGYSALQRKAYYMGLGAGMCGVNVNSDNAVELIDSRQGTGQRVDLCASARRGIVEGYKHRYGGTPFDRDGWVLKKSKKRRR